MTRSVSQIAREIERGLDEQGISVGRFIRLAQIDRSTWTRWKNGSFTPRLTTWRRAIETAQALGVSATPRTRPQRSRPSMPLTRALATVLRRMQRALDWCLSRLQGRISRAERGSEGSESFPPAQALEDAWRRGRWTSIPQDSLSGQLSASQQINPDLLSRLNGDPR